MKVNKQANTEKDLDQRIDEEESKEMDTEDKALEIKELNERLETIKTAKEEL